ncbi:MAG: hypothetical protein ACRDHC_06125 [Actinomycetota bacterium]
MIPTLILVGLVFGRWWRFVIPLAAVGWPVLLIVTGEDSGLDFVLAAAALAVANVVVGVLVFQVLWRFVKGLTAATRTR